MEIEKFESWAIVSLLGRNQIAGKCSEQSIAGTLMLRVDVPETDKTPSFTKFYGGSSIYSIDPVTEEIAKAYAVSLHIQPIEAWDIRRYMQKIQPAIAGNGTGRTDGDNYMND